MGLIAGTPDWLRKPRAISREAATMGRCISECYRDGFNGPKYPHGTNRGYMHGCKCDLCRKAHSDYMVPVNRSRMETSDSARIMKRLSDDAYRLTERGQAVRRAGHARRKLHMNIAYLPIETVMVIDKIYMDCPEGYHVDHIVPLNKGGAHMPYNLQYLPEMINMRKKDNESFDCSLFAISWKDWQLVKSYLEENRLSSLNEVVAEPSSTIPEGSRAKRSEMPHILGSNKDDDIVRSA